MKKSKRLLACATLLCASLLATGCGNKNEDVYEDGKLVLNLRNLYFSSWDGSDPYTAVIEDKFNVKIKPSSYDYDNWGSQVEGDLNANNLDDVFHFDLESFNFGNTYKEWANGLILKALPSDLSRWPKVKNIIDNVSNVDALKIDGKLYGIPLSFNQNDPEKNYSSFTYLYRRDWVKAIDESHKHGSTYDAGYPLLHEDDTYTWEEFLKIVDEFGDREDVKNNNAYAIGDVAWGFPSLTNFYKDSPHCYQYNSDKSKVINAFTTDGYISGLELTRKYILTDGIYFSQNAHENDTKVYDEYKAGRLGIYYENLSLTNYSTLRKDIKDIKAQITDTQLDDMTAIMRIKGPDGKFHLEGSENWFSMTMFNYDISDAKMEKILDILNYLLDDEGTKLAVYGKENVDYTMNDGEVELIDFKWPKDSDTGEYIKKNNGAKYLREMITLNYDTASFDPFTDQKSYQIIKKWEDEMNAARTAGNLKIFSEPSEIKWLTTPLKDARTSGLINAGNEYAMDFCYGVRNYQTVDEYKAAFNKANWLDTIAEINSYLGK